MFEYLKKLQCYEQESSKIKLTTLVDQKSGGSHIYSHLHEINLTEASVQRDVRMRFNPIQQIKE